MKRGGGGGLLVLWAPVGCHQFSLISLYIVNVHHSIKSFLLIDHNSSGKMRTLYFCFTVATPYYTRCSLFTHHQSVKAGVLVRFQQGGWDPTLPGFSK